MAKTNKDILTRDEFAHKFSMRLDKLMRSKRITNRMLAEQVECDASTINSYRNEKSVPDAYMIYKIAKALPCTIEALISF